MPGPDSSSGPSHARNSPTECDEWSDTDEANTATARVHLGSFNHLSEHGRVLPQSFKTPARPIRPKRKPPSRRTPIVLEDVAGEARGDQSESEDRIQSVRATTPDQATIFEEPSSVLGSRILRALDNPSPPPQLDNLPVDSEDEDEHVTDISPLLQPAASVSAHRLASANPPETAPFEDLQGALSDFEGGQLGSVGPMDEDIVPPQPELIPSDLASTPPAQTSATLVLTESEETAVYKGLTGPSEELLDPMAVDEAPVTPVTGVVEADLPLTSSTSAIPQQREILSPEPNMTISHDQDGELPSPAPSPPTSNQGEDQSEAEAPAAEAPAIISTPEHVPVRRSARLSATPRTPTLTSTKKRTTRTSSPLKHDVADAIAESGAAPSEPRPLNIVKKSAQPTPILEKEPEVSTSVVQTGPQQLLAPPSTAQTRRKGKGRSVSPGAMELSGDESDPNDLVKGAFGQGDVLMDGLSCSPGKAARWRIKAEEPIELHRNLGSLSPGSANLLTTLVFSDKADVGGVEPAIAIVVDTTEDRQQAAPLETNIQQPDIVLPSTPQRPKPQFTTPKRAQAFPQANPNSKAVMTPARVASPLRRQPGAEDASEPVTGAAEAPHTPARRVLVSESGYRPTPMAIQRGRLVPATPQAKSTAAGRTAVPPSPAYMQLAAGTRKPARVPLGGAAAGLGGEPVLGTSSKSAQAPDSQTVDDAGSQPVAPSTFTAKPTSVAGSSRVPLPHPVLPSRIPSPVKQGTRPLPQSGSDSDDSGPAPTAPNALQSALRQSSPAIASRIPRIGAKPYTRPAPTGRKGKAKEGKMVSSARNAAGNALHSMDEDHPEASAGADEPPVTTLIIPAASTTTPLQDGPKRARDPTAPTASSLKRKREAEETRGTTVARSTPKGIASKIPSSVPARARPPPRSGRVTTETTTTVQRVTTDLRRVGVAAKHNWVEVEDEEMVEPPLPTASAPLDAVQATPHVASAAEPESLEDEQPASARAVRRTSRGRKASEPTFDVPAVVMPAPLPNTPRRKSASKPIFGTAGVPNVGGLTNVALQALTLKNTARNQQYYATLETEIVRKDGNRPGSPGMKVRTVAQRQQEEREQGRAERAARRSRRGSGSALSDAATMSEVGDMGMGDEEEQEEAEVAPEMEKHRRGAGEEEDYETPSRPMPGIFGQPTAVEVRAGKRSVKWDRGLFTEVYLDEIAPKPKKPATVEGKKGCLASKAKALRLDALGNLVDAQTPFPVVGQENIVVKKFVYDDDAGGEEEVVESETEYLPPPPKRSSRRKSGEDGAAQPEPAPPKRVSRRKSKT